jgi:hypothetical protein
VLGILARRSAVVLTHGAMRAECHGLGLDRQVGLADGSALADDPHPGDVDRLAAQGVIVMVKIAVVMTSDALMAVTVTVVVPTGNNAPDGGAYMTETGPATSIAAAGA